MWFGTKDGIGRYDGYSFKIFRNEIGNERSLRNNFISSLYEDIEGNIWIGTEEGLAIYDPKDESLTSFYKKTREGHEITQSVKDIKSDAEGNLWFAADWKGVFSYNIGSKELFFHPIPSEFNARSICFDRENKIWLGTNKGGLCLFNEKTGAFDAYLARGLNKDMLSQDISLLYQDSYNNLLIGSADKGVQKLSAIDGEVSPLVQDEEMQSLFVRSIIRVDDKELWISSESGIYVYNTKNGSYTHIVHDQYDSHSLSDNAVYSLYKDREGGIWAGSYFGGLNYYPPQNSAFSRHYPRNKSSMIKGKRIREFQQDTHGALWIGTEDEGLNYYSPSTGLAKNFSPLGRPGDISYHNIHGLMVDGNNLWIGTFMHGLDVMDMKTQRVIRHYDKTDDSLSLSDKNIFALYKDISNNIWVGTTGGLSLYNRQQDNFTKVDFIGNSFIYDIFQSQDGLLWFASFGSGLFRYNPRTTEWKSFRHNAKDSTSLAQDKIISIFEDSNNLLWFATEGGGISQYHAKDETFTSFTTEDGLPSNIIYKILEDKAGLLWMTSNNGLIRFNPKNKELKIFTTNNGLLGDQFNYKSGIKTADGRLYFGCLNGFISFDPSTFVENRYIPPVVITDFYLLNKEVEVGTENSPLKQSITYTDSIELNYKQSSFSFAFAALSFAVPTKNKYQYILQGFEKEWNTMAQKQKVTYSNLPPGKYTFRVKASNSDGLWNENSRDVFVVIRPPFFQTGIAYMTYLIATLSIVVFLISTYRRRMERKNKDRLEQFENEKERELYNAKISFFTNIAHEIRTPLTLIKGPLEHILQEQLDVEEQKEHLQIIERNTNRLLDLSNQLLDFRKTEIEGFRLNYVKTDISRLIKETHSRFKPSAMRRGLNMTIEIPQDSFFADVDQEALTKILSNLFNNALKYAKSEILLTLFIEIENSNEFLIRISSDGNLIKNSEKEKIFEPFYQLEETEGNRIKSGTGLGLPLARSLAELHHGSLKMDESLEHANVFLLKLPIKQENVVALKESDSLKQESDSSYFEDSGQDSKLTILLVEDDNEMRQFIYNRLKDIYCVRKAKNGLEALETLQKEIVDLVISDVMMPLMDGLQLCSEIKSNVNFSHIPIILLTAKVGLEPRIEGLSAGADAYVDKPFSMDHLLAQISNLLANRLTVKKAFMNLPQQAIDSIALTNADENFLFRVSDIIHKNLADKHFKIEMLAEDLGMSRSSLHRKIRGISELTPSDFISLIRLKKAAELLAEGSYRINEVCHIVGFSSSSYFSKSFKKQFGMSPKDYVKQEKE
ncbi:hybrid sensor histidine kinase/response regulator [Bacteroidales bacterium]|nr:hybrid sensor histidine kinase/response regulator [Bacteroidales bacterium]